MNIELRYREFLPEARRIVVKIGTRVIAQKSGRPDMLPLKGLVKQIAALHRQGYEILLVSSGAVGAGVEALGMKTRPTSVPDLQMCAAVGQARLMAHYEALFLAEKITIGQVLLTHSDFQHRIRFANAKRTMEHMIRHSVIPIINENDVVAVDELEGQKFGDNDILSATVANLVDADLLALLTNIDGLFTADPRKDPGAQQIPFVDKIDERLEKLAGGFPMAEPPALAVFGDGCRWDLAFMPWAVAILSCFPSPRPSPAGRGRRGKSGPMTLRGISEGEADEADQTHIGDL